MHSHPMFSWLRNLRQLAHVFDRGLAKFFTDCRQQPMTHAITKEGSILIDESSRQL